MDTPQRRRIGLLVGGGVVALVAGAVIAWSLTAPHKNEAAPPPPASQGGLVIDATSPPDTHVSPAKTLRCFSGGQYVGDFTLAECAKRNGVATDALDVGVDQTGALAAQQQGGAAVTPLPPKEAVAQPKPEAGPLATCWRYDGSWRRLNDMSETACIQTLFAGKCEKPGEAAYGRWGQQTLRLVQGKVEVSADNHSFRTFTEQGPNCTLPNL